MTDPCQAIRSARWFTGCALALALMVAAIPPARADLIFLKDGFVLQGIIKRDHKLELDPYSKESYTVPAGHYWVDDGPRRIYFSQGLVGRVENKIAPNEERIVRKHKATILNPVPMPSLDTYLEEPAWSDGWDRTAKLRVAGTNMKMLQCITAMTPYWTRVDAGSTFSWAAAYMTRELGLDQVRRLITAHPEFEEKDRMTEVEKSVKRFRYVDFFTQAGWYDEAESELQRLAKDLPSQKEKAEAGLKALRVILARDKYETIKRMHLAGQYDLVRKRMADFPVDSASEQVQADLREFKSEYDATFEKVGEARKLLQETALDLGTENQPLFADAAREIYRELHPGNLARLDTFLGQARQYIRQKGQKQKTDLSPEQVLSLGISGWLLGSTAAESKVETGLKLWKARTLVLESLRTPTTAGRLNLINAYNALPEKDRAPIDWFVQMIPHLPPAAPEEQIGGAPMSLTVGEGRGAVSYTVQLPAEYRHSQSYPVLMVLHDAGEKPEAMVRRWTEAVDLGYIVVAPSWETGGAAGGPFGAAGGSYGFSDREHETALGTLRDLRRRFNIDSDRVFLFGYGYGGTMAFDVGLAHPDLFAGLIPMNGLPVYFPAKYWRNSMYLPCYVVSGERTGEIYNKTKLLFDAWILRGYSSVWVQYKGRGVEWFTGEVPLILDWMRSKRRVLPMRALGNDGGIPGLGAEFQSMRSSDNRFYWLSTDQIAPRSLCTAQTFNHAIQPASFTARIDFEQNKVIVKPKNVKQVTIWLGRNSKGEETIDFSRFVTVQVNLDVKIPAKKIEPSLGVLLEDLAQRGDRQQLFLARIDLNF